MANSNSGPPAAQSHLASREARREGKDYIVQVLLDHDADADVPDPDCCCILHQRYATTTPSRWALALLDYDADLDADAKFPGPRWLDFAFHCIAVG